VALTLTLMAGCDAAPADPTRKQKAPPPPAVEVVAARTGSLPLVERLSGVVRASNQVAIRAEVTAPVVEVLVRTGDAVERGQVLVRLRDDIFRDQLLQAEAAVRLEEAAARAARARVAELEAQLRRTQALAERSLVSALEVDVLEAQVAGALAVADQVDARVEQARATVGERETALARTVVRAPISGRVGRRAAEVGMLADAGAVLFEVGDLTRVIVDVPLTDAMLGHLRPGQPAVLTPPGADAAPIAATLARISPFLARGSFSTTGELDAPNPDGRLYPGMFVTALEGEPPADAPSTAAYPVARRSVEVLAVGRDTVGVTGVEAGEWVVTIGQHLLARGGVEAGARARGVAWERVLALQSRHREDVLREFMANQQRHARSRGAEPPSTEEFLEAASEAPGEAELPVGGG
jgi:RND family efflux transporter MFP subunit